MKNKNKILCGSFLVGLFLLFGFSNHALAYAFNLIPGCTNSTIYKFQGAEDVNDPITAPDNHFDVYCGGIPTTTDGNIIGFTTLVDIYQCSFGSIYDGVYFPQCTENFEETGYVNRNMDFSIENGGFFSTFSNFNDLEYQSVVYTTVEDYVNFIYTLGSETSTPVLGILDTIGTSIFSTIIYFITLFFTQFWPIVLVVALATAFISSLTYYILKIINQR